MAVKHIAIAALCGVTGCAHTSVAPHGITAGEIRATDQRLAANGDLVTRTKRCRLAVEDVQMILAMAQHAPVVRSDPSPDFSFYGYKPDGHYLISFSRGHQQPLLLFFDPSETAQGNIRLNGVSRVLDASNMGAFKRAVAQAGCATWVQQEAMAK